MMKYAKDIPALTSPARAPNDQNAILSSPSGFLAFFIAKTRQITANKTPSAVTLPKTISRILSDRRTSFHDEAAEPFGAAAG
jgi:hypothetical protein